LFKNLFFSLLFFFPSFVCKSQKIVLLTQKNGISLRGLSVVDNKIIWVSGSNGTVGKSEDGGKSWKWITVRGFEKIDFRDIEAFSKNIAVIMGTAEPAYILRTADGGISWTKVFEDTTTGMFLDAMEFWNEQSGIVIGDPINNRFFIGRTFDGGKTWRSIPEQFKPAADSGEACFASSGTNIRKLNKAEAVFISGGLTTHLFWRDKKIEIPLIHGTQSTGANSMAVKNSKTMIIVGGDFTKAGSIERNCAITTDGGKTFHQPESAPIGYRSCVEFLNKNKWITCGLNGVDISVDNGMNWRNISTESFHVCRKAKKGNVVFLAGKDGKIGKLIY